AHSMFFLYCFLNHYYTRFKVKDAFLIVHAQKCPGCKAPRSEQRSILLQVCEQRSDEGNAAGGHFSA
ncbi:MAG: hypothetical protein AAB197_01765, partial [Deltaproteobacteria bacterium]